MSDETEVEPIGNSEIRSHTWMAGFESQTGDKAIGALVRFARGRLRGVAKLGGVVDALTPREMILDILGDVFEGTLTWSPEREPLRSVVERTIHSRTYYLRKHAVQYKRTSIDGATRETLAEIERIGEPDVLTVEERDLVRRVLKELRDRAAGDADVVRLIDAYEHGARDKADVMEIARMSGRVYDRSRKRLNRFIGQLSPELRERSPIHA
jgi:hypothetical protein